MMKHCYKKQSLFVTLMSWTVLSVATENTVQNCTTYRVGLSTYHDETNVEITVAVAESTIGASVDIATSEARMLARNLLLQSPLFKGDEKKIAGVMDANVCIENDSLYAVVKTSEAKVKQARETAKNIESAITDSPTPKPKPENLPNETEMKNEFDRLMNQTIPQKITNDLDKNKK